MNKLQQAFSVTFRYDVHFTRQLFHPDNPLFHQLISTLSEQQPARLLFVIDEGVAEYHPMLPVQIAAYTTRFSEILRLTREPVIVPGGEAAKNDPGMVKQLLRMIHEDRIDRHAYVAAIGGGAVLDMAGYAAAIAHRGIRHIRIPTTVLSQNDSGVGVKNGINYFGKKNFLGCFAPPVAVINDLDFLHTLDDRDWLSGISEAIKVSLIKDASFFEFLEKEVTALRRREDRPMAHLIRECARLHLEHIAGGDPFEMGSSRPLDFGHWAAHKLEQLTDYQLRHGEAVAIGIALDATYAHLQGMLPKPEWRRIIRLMQELGLKLYTPELEQKKEDRLIILDGLEEFREHLGGQLTIMLLEKIGQSVEVHEIDTTFLQQAVQTIKRIHQTAILS
jgi:3-dehydroquinate synthase